MQREMRRNIKIIAKIWKKNRKQSKEKCWVYCSGGKFRQRKSEYGTETLGNELLVVWLGIHVDIIGLLVNFKFLITNK